MNDKMNDTQQFLAQFGEAIAEHLSAGKLWWKLNKVDDTYIELGGANGMKITLWCGATNFMLRDGEEDKIKFKVWGSYPPDVYIRDEDKPNINVGYSKGARAVANDIQRRFLSKYVPLYYEKLEIQQGIERDRTARERLVNDLAEAFDWKIVRDRDGLLVRTEAGYNSGTNYTGKLNANYTTSLKPESERRWEVSLELKSLSVDQALRIAEVLREPAFPPEQLTFF